MRTATRTAALALALAFGAWVATALGADQVKRANLDSDPELERVVAEEVCLSEGALRGRAPCANDEFPARRMVLEDTCQGMPARYLLSRVQDTVERFQLAEIDGRRGRPEVFFLMRSGASGRVAYARLYRYLRRRGAPCPAPSRLFAFPSRGTLGPIPRGAEGRAGSDVRVREYSRRFGGKELQVIETYVDRDDAFCCPSFRRTSYFRFSRRRGAYVRFATTVRRIRPAGATPY